jgi:hypothetical protein
VLKNPNYDKDKYSVVYMRKNNAWMLTGYVCKTCLMKFQHHGRMMMHSGKCSGKPNTKNMDRE